MTINPLIFQFFSISNFFLNIFVVFLFLFFGYEDIAAQGFITISISNIFTYGFSGNVRNIYLGSKNIISLKKTIIFRLLISIIAILSSSILIYFFLSKDNFLYLFSILIITVSSFIFELLIARTEKNGFINIYHAFNILIFFIVSLLLFHFDLLQNFIIYVFIHIILNFFIFRTFFKSLFIENFEFLVNFEKNINIGIYSSFFKMISNLIWRYSAFILLGDSRSAVLFMAFSLGSFFGTLFDISYGALFLKKIKKSISFFLNLMFLIYSIMIFIFILLFQKYSYLNIENNFLYLATIFSLMGSYVIIGALRLRQKYFEMPLMQNFCYGADILIYFFNSLLIILLYFIREELVILAYFISSTFFYLVYKIIVQNDYKKKYSK